MIRKVLILFSGIVALVGCSSRTPHIDTICERDRIGNYIIKWETDPQLEGMLKVYVSDNPETFNNPNPSIYANINDGITTYITRDRVSRQYFRLSFNDKHYRTVGARLVEMDSIQNLRDLGGYYTSKDKMVRWGQIFRSAELTSLSDWDSIRLDRLHIKTIIDLRSQEDVLNKPILYKKANVVHIPIPIEGEDNLSSRILEGRMRKGDALLYMQDQYLQFITKDKELFAQALDLFLDKDNYPIIFNCTLGKDRVGFLAALLLSALDIPEEVIINDYTTSNNYIDISSFASLAHGLSTEAQETVTALLSSNESLMNFALQRIRKDYGSLDKYLSNELDFNEKKQSKLKELMLY